MHALILGLMHLNNNAIMVIFFFQLNTGQFNSSFAGADHKIQRAWIQGLTGCGVTVAVVDDGKNALH